MPDIWRETTAEHINQVLNHPDVRPWIADESVGVVDVSALVANPRNVLLMGPHGGCFCIWLMAGVYEVHTQFLPEGRGHGALEFVQAGSHWMFTRTDCYEIITRVPQGYVAARALTLAAGMTHEFRREDGTVLHGTPTPVDIYSFRIQDWMPKAPYMEERGLWFHDRLADEAQKAGITQPIHPDDANHNRYVGAVYDMIVNGQAPKGVQLYNRWAMAARHPTIRLLQVSPPMVEFDIGTLTLDPSGDLQLIPHKREAAA